MIDRRTFLKIGSLSISYVLLSGVKGLVRAGVQDVSYKNRMNDLTLENFVGYFPNLRPQAYWHRYIAFTDPGEQLLFSIESPSTQLQIDYAVSENPQEAGSWFVDVFFRSLDVESEQTVKFIFSISPPIGEKIVAQREDQIQLFDNFPNPFNPSTKISYYLPRTTPVKGIVYNMLGETVAVLVDEVQRSGKHELIWNAENLPSGIYIFSLITNNSKKTIKMMRVK